MTDEEAAREFADRWIEFSSGQERSERHCVEELTTLLAAARREGFKEARELAADAAERRAQSSSNRDTRRSGSRTALAIRALQPAQGKPILPGEEAAGVPSSGVPPASPAPSIASKEPCPTCGGSGRIFAHGPDFIGRMEACAFCQPKEIS